MSPGKDHGDVPGQLRVLVTHLDSASGGNPTLPLLFNAMREAGDVYVQPYSTHAVLTARWDIVHIYWAEWMIRRAGNIVLTAADAARVLAELQLAKARGAKIVWTANNIRPHEMDRVGVVASFVSAVTRLVDQVICPSQTVLDQFQFEYPAISDLDQRVVAPGSYRGIYLDEKRTAVQARTILDLPEHARIVLAFGMVRPYKNIPQMLHCYEQVLKDRNDTFLLIAGKPLNQHIADDIQRTCDRLRSVRADLRHIVDDEVQDYMRASNCLMIGTSFAVTTGSGILALSFDLPVLMPHRGAAIDIQDFIGADWVHTYDGGLRPSVVNRAFDIERPEGSPDLDEHYSWTKAGHGYLDAYLHLLGRDRPKS